MQFLTLQKLTLTDDKNIGTIQSESYGHPAMIHRGDSDVKLPALKNFSLPDSPAHALSDSRYSVILSVTFQFKCSTSGYRIRRDIKITDFIAPLARRDAS